MNNQSFFQPDPNVPEGSELSDEPELSEESEYEDPILPAIEEIREELQASTGEQRRNTRRVFDAIKQLGGMLDMLSQTVLSIHEDTRAAALTRAASPAPSVGTDANAGALMDLAERVLRVEAAALRVPELPKVRWPASKKAVAILLEERARFAESLAILAGHTESMLAAAGLHRIPCEGRLFDPGKMRAVETITDPSVADHTVLAELVPGWEDATRVLRPAQVRVARQKSNNFS